MKRIAVLPLLVAISAQLCLAAEPVQLDSRFDRDEVSWIEEPGTATVSGQAHLTLRDGSRKGCAGFHVELLPVARYSTERILKTYGNTERGQVLLEDNPPKFTPDAAGYHEMVIKASCDQRHRFSFRQVPAGDYYVIAFIIWDVPGAPGTKTGGGAMKRLRVEPGSANELLVEGWRLTT